MLDERTTTFLMVCEKMNYTRAAEALHITQPAVSRHIRFLEGYYDVKLFTMDGKKVCLTDEGRLLREALIKMDNDERSLKEKLRISSGGMISLKLGVTLTVGEFMIADTVAQYKISNPGTSVCMKVSNTAELLADLRKGDIHFAVLEGNYPKNEFDSVVFADEPFICVAAPGHPAPAKISSIKDLTGYELVVRERGSGTRDILENALAVSGFSIDDFADVIEIQNMNAIKNIVAAGCGMTFLYRAAAEDMINAGRLRRIAVSDIDTTHEISVIWNRDMLFSEDLTSIVKRFLCRSAS